MKKFDVKDEKITGYIFLIVGLIIMLYSLVLVLNVAGTGMVPVEFIETPESSNINNPVNLSGNQTMPSIDMSSMMIPLFPMFNISLWLVICFFILVVGGKISSVGINMMKATVPDIRIVKSETIKKIVRNDEFKQHQKTEIPKDEKQEIR